MTADPGDTGGGTGRGSWSAGGQFADNIAVFVRVLRAAGLRLGPGDTIAAVQAAAAIDVTRRDDLFWALHGVLITDPRDRALFAETFAHVFRDPAGAHAALSLLAPVMSPAFRNLSDSRTPGVSRRLAEALARARRGPPRADPAGELDPSRPDDPDEVTVDAAMTWSDRETLRHRDFEQMSVAELAAAQDAIARMDLGVRPRATRRFRPDPRGPLIDARAMFRALARTGEIAPRWRTRRVQPPPLVVICDISGSMQRYSRMLLVLAHALTHSRARAARGRVWSFVFGTRLTHVTRLLRDRDVDAALAACGRAVADWGGGTRIAASLAGFNRDWSRRVLGRGAVVLLVTDGLDRPGPDDPVVDAGAGGRLAAATARLRRSCRKLIWLNPLLRYAGFEPRARGVRAMLPNVDEHRPIHDLASLDQLAAALRAPDVRDSYSVSAARRGQAAGRTTRESPTTAP